MENETTATVKARKKKKKDVYPLPTKMLEPTDRSALVTANRFVRFLHQNPQNVRDAIVLSEVLGKPISLR